MMSALLDHLPELSCTSSQRRIKTIFVLDLNPSDFNDTSNLLKDFSSGLVSMFSILGSVKLFSLPSSISNIKVAQIILKKKKKE